MPTILTYHSQILSGDDYARNDHVALAADLRLLTDCARPVVPLSFVLDAFDGLRNWSSLTHAVVLTFDDGAVLDWRDIDYPGLGPQRSFANLMRDHIEQTGTPLCASSFAIASRRAREEMDRLSLFGRGWLSDDWWSEATREQMIAIESHGLDHDHPDVDPTDPKRGNFARIDDPQSCALQIDRASHDIERISGRRPQAFAYPYGQASDYLRRHYLPSRGPQIGLRGAVSTEPGAVGPGSDRWWLPRYVCNRDWCSTAELRRLLESH